jgi:hypothetical protein
VVVGVLVEVEVVYPASGMLLCVGQRRGLVELDPAVEPTGFAEGKEVRSLGPPSESERYRVNKFGKKSDEYEYSGKCNMLKIS